MNDSGKPDIPWNEGLEPAPPFEARVLEEVRTTGVERPVLDFQQVEAELHHGGVDGDLPIWRMAVPRLNRGTELGMLIDGQLVRISERGRSCEELEANPVPFTVVWADGAGDGTQVPLRPQYVVDQEETPREGFVWVVETPPLGALVLRIVGEDGYPHTIHIQLGGGNDG